MIRKILFPFHDTVYSLFKFADMLDLRIYPTAPVLSSWRSTLQSPNIVKAIIFKSGIIFKASSAASSPFIRGMSMSINTRSGFRYESSSINSIPFGSFTYYCSNIFEGNDRYNSMSKNFMIINYNNIRLFHLYYYILCVICFHRKYSIRVSSFISAKLTYFWDDSLYVLLFLLNLKEFRYTSIHRNVMLSFTIIILVHSYWILCFSCSFSCWTTREKQHGSVRLNCIILYFCKFYLFF